MERIGRQINDPFQRHTGGISRKHRRSETVHGRLNDHIGDGETGTLQPGRQPDPKHPFQNREVDPQVFETQPPCLFRPVQCPENEDHGKQVSDPGGNGDAGDIPLENDHEQQTQQHIQCTGGNEIIERTAGIAGAPHDRRAKVINHIQRHCDEINLHICTGKIDHIIRGFCPNQKFPGKKITGQRNSDPDNQGKQKRSMGRPADFFPFSRSDVVGDQNVGSDRKSHGGIDQKPAEGCCRPHSTEGLF